MLCKFSDSPTLTSSQGFVFLNCAKPSSSAVAVSDKRAQAQTQSFSNLPQVIHLLNEGVINPDSCPVCGAPSRPRDEEGP